MNREENDPIYLNALYDVLGRLGGDDTHASLSNLDYESTIKEILSMVEAHEEIASKRHCRLLRRKAAKLVLQKGLVELAEDILELDLLEEK